MNDRKISSQPSRSKLSQSSNIRRTFSFRSNTKAFEVECLDEHNRYRALHGCPPLTLTENLCELACEWALQISLITKLVHRAYRQYGENLFTYECESLANVNGRMAVKSWYDEISNYNFDIGKYSPNTENFTQLMWKGTEEMGVGFHLNTKEKSICVVAYYNPSGNFNGKFIDNVPPLIQSSPKP